uniref:Hexosyltransferase n=1 Tax=Aureoumbra lagunensis TaxID=44058 RepID=A0A7S3JTM7_9STRA|mmetsp:Transcript_2789/g.3847  ORF Transcript_2789/g.3847 Transcript_2789/m.3847 type:complete len:477 (+) Transcript_2789:78-1508(+)
MRLRINLTLIFVVLAVEKNGNEVGICYVRNQVQYNVEKNDFDIDLKEWRWLWISAKSLSKALDRNKLGTCLFTDAPERVVSYAIEQLEKNESWKQASQVFRINDENKKITTANELFDIIKSYENDELALAQRIQSLGLEKEYREIIESKLGSASKKMIKSRLSRIRFFSMAPFRITLFVDDDVLFCPNKDLAIQLQSLNTQDHLIRIAEHETSFPKYIDRHVQKQFDRIKSCSQPFYSNDQLKNNPLLGRLITQQCWNQSAFLEKELIDLQAGAIFLPGKNNSASLAFTNDWTREYLKYWHTIVIHFSSSHLVKNKFQDQPPLDRIAQLKIYSSNYTNFLPYNTTVSSSKWSLAPLPPELNGRFLTKGSIHHIGAVLLGPLTLLHSTGFIGAFHSQYPSSDILHYYQTNICAPLNSILTPRYVKGNAAKILLHAARQSPLGNMISSDEILLIAPILQNTSSVRSLLNDGLTTANSK